ncbi:putative transporter SVOPL [Dreissena polymorpha]|uniref:putative transporter SVOPL n=1 Tax=Dreissena polymorpha TaxID=45954 RepID=UPI002263F125|nr:putative transporter SVOPL [Dreissena polymorpha]
MVWIMWFGTALSYYGMVLASAEILQIKNANQSGEKCKCNLLKKDDYTSMIVSTLGEFIALPLHKCLIDLVGIRWTGAVNLFGCGLFFIFLQLPVPMTVLTGFIFLVRGCSAGMFNFIYIYTSAVYPTTIRTLGIGAASSWARVGAVVTPFLAQVLMDTSLTAAVWVYGSIGFICAVLLETSLTAAVWVYGSIGFICAVLLDTSLTAAVWVYGSIGFICAQSVSVEVD